MLVGIIESFGDQKKISGDGRCQLESLAVPEWTSATHLLFTDIQ
jgi:hypothetical protein